MTNMARVELNLHYTRNDALEAVVDLDEYAKTSYGMNANDMMDYLQNAAVPYSVGVGDTMLENCSDLEVTPTFDGDLIEEEEIWPADGLPEEFHEKQRNLAVFLFNMNNGPVASVTEWLDQWGDTDYYENYMRDAAEIIKLQPHLLTLPTRELMGLWP